MLVKRFPSVSIHPFKSLIVQCIKAAAYCFAATIHMLISFITFLPFSFNFSISATLLMYCFCYHPLPRAAILTLKIK